MHQLGAIIAIIVLGIGGLVLGAFAVMMIIGAIVPKRSDVSSWPTAQEATFSPFNQKNVSNQGTAWTISLITAVAVFFVVVGVYFGVKPEIRDVSKTMNMSNLTKKSGEAAPAPKAEEAPKAEAPKAEEPKADEPKSDEPTSDE